MTGTKNALATIAQQLPDAPIPPMVGIGAIALQMAMQYHDATVVKDGVMYQQLKLDGKNIGILTLDCVFETAKKIEQHLMGTNDRIAGMVIDTLMDGIALEEEWETTVSSVLSEEGAPKGWTEGFLVEWNKVRDEDFAIPEDIEERLLFTFYEYENIAQEQQARFVEFLDERYGPFVQRLKEIAGRDDPVSISSSIFSRTLEELVSDVFNRKWDDMPDADALKEIHRAKRRPLDFLSEDYFCFLDTYMEAAGIPPEERSDFNKLIELRERLFAQLVHARMTGNY